MLAGASKGPGRGYGTPREPIERALADDALSATTKESIRRAYGEVCAGCDQLSALKLSLAGDRARSGNEPPRGER